jgi:hypothetical protein
VEHLVAVVLVVVDLLQLCQVHQEHQVGEAVAAAVLLSLHKQTQQVEME